MSTAGYAIECDDLRRVFHSRSLLGRVRETVALDSLTLRVEPGLVFGLLGPNGAGKTTTIRVLTTLLTPTSGSARVGGYDVARQESDVRRRIGLVLGGDRGLYGRISGRQNLQYFAALNAISPRDANPRIDALLEEVGLSHAADTLVERYSRGMKQRLHIARGLLTEPDVLFLDEPTSGLDPASARDFRRLVPQMTERGRTVILTTHYMLEADQLCDRIGIIDHGRLVALDDPAGIKRRFTGGQVIEARFAELPDNLAEDLQRLDPVLRVEIDADGSYQRMTVFCEDGTPVEQLLAGLDGERQPEAIVSRAPTLEEAYLEMLSRPDPSSAGSPIAP